MKRLGALRIVFWASIFAAAYPSPARPADLPPAPTQFPASATFNLEEGERWIDFKGLQEHRIIIPVKLNGSPLLALIDTGAPNTTISTSWAKQHGMHLLNGSMTHGANGLEAKRWRAAIQSFDVGGFHQVGGGVDVIDMESFINLSSSPRFDMILGIQFLASMVTEIDFDHARVRIRLKGQPPANSKPVPIAFSKDRNIIFTSLTVNNRAIGRLRVDTGDNSYLAITKAAIHPYNPQWRVTDVASVGLGGAYLSDYARLDKVSWGSIVFNDVSTDIEDKAVDEGEAGMIGLALLEHYNIYLDGPQSIMMLSERTTQPPPPIISNMGIQGNMTEQGWSVFHVMRHSPAEQIGLKKGDVICSVDGHKMTVSSDIPRGPDNSIMQLAMCDGRALQLTRRAFY